MAIAKFSFKVNEIISLLYNTPVSPTKGGGGERRNKNGSMSVDTENRPVVAKETGVRGGMRRRLGLTDVSFYIESG